MLSQTWGRVEERKECSSGLGVVRLLDVLGFAVPPSAGVHGILLEIAPCFTAVVKACFYKLSWQFL